MPWKVEGVVKRPQRDLVHFKHCTKVRGLAEPENCLKEGPFSLYKTDSRQSALEMTVT